MRKSIETKNFLRALARLVVVAAGLATTASFALTPLPMPDGPTPVEAGKSVHFVGAWSVKKPTMEVGTPDTKYATCALPVRIEAVNATRILYRGPRDQKADEAIELIPEKNGARWQPTAGGSDFFAMWRSPDMFYLYDSFPQPGSGWGMPFVYERCP